MYERLNNPITIQGKTYYGYYYTGKKRRRKAKFRWLYTILTGIISYYFVASGISFMGKHPLPVYIIKSLDWVPKISKYSAHGSIRQLSHPLSGANFIYLIVISFFFFVLGILLVQLINVCLSKTIEERFDIDITQTCPCINDDSFLKEFGLTEKNE